MLEGGYNVDGLGDAVESHVSQLIKVWQFKVTSENAITIIGGAFSEMFPSDIKNVQGLVKNYDGVLEVVSEWPDADNKKYLQSETGNEYNYYTVKTET